MKTTTKIIIGFVGALFLLCIIVPLCIIEPSHDSGDKYDKPVDVNITMERDTLELDTFNHLVFEPEITVSSDTLIDLYSSLIITEKTNLEKPRLIYPSSLKNYIDITVYGEEDTEEQICQIAEKENVHVKYIASDSEALIFRLEVPRGMLTLVNSECETTFRDFRDMEINYTGNSYLLENCTVKSFGNPLLNYEY